MSESRHVTIQDFLRILDSLDQDVPVRPGVLKAAIVQHYHREHTRTELARSIMAMTDEELDIIIKATEAKSG